MTHTTREGKIGLGTHAYKTARATRFTMTRMGDDSWCVFENGEDTGRTFNTLRAAREWVGQQSE